MASACVPAALIGGAQAKPLDVLGNAPAFGLTDQLDRPAKSDDFAGKVVVADFIYTSCPDVCPLLSSRMQALQARLDEAHLLPDRVQLLSFTVDPARDTPPVLKAYAERYKANPASWRFLTGPEQYVIPLERQGFHLAADVAPGQPPEARSPQYTVVHASSILLIDKQWRVRAYLDGNNLDLDQTLKAVKQLAA